MPANKEPDLSGFLTTSQVAKLYGCKPVDIQRCIKKGLIKAQHVGYFYLIWEPGLPDTLPVRQVA